MGTLKILLITFPSAILLGCIAGVIIGKIQVRRMRSTRGPVVSRRELLVLTGVVLIGIGCVLVGVFYKGGEGEGAINAVEPGGMMAYPGMDGKGALPAEGGADMVIDDEQESGDGEDNPDDTAEDETAEEGAEEPAEGEETLGVTVKDSGNTTTTQEGTAVAIARPRAEFVVVG